MFWFHRESHADHFRKIAIGFFVLSLLLIGIVLYISFSWATITLTPKTVALSEGFEFDIVDSGKGVLADQLHGGIKKEEREVKGTFLASGETVSSPEVQRAQGLITIMNQSGSSQPLRATTRLSAPDGTLFRTTAYVVVPAGGRVEASVIADIAKELPDLSSVRFTIPGLQPARQSQVYGVGFSKKPFVSAAKKVISQADIDSAIQSLESELKTQAEQSLASDGRVVLVTPTTIAKSADVGEKAESFTVRMSATVQAISFDRSELRARINQLLLRRLPQGFDLIPSTNEDITLEVASIDPPAKKVTLKAVVSAARIRNSESSDIDKAKLSGLSAEGIADYFRAFPDISAVDVQFYPVWVTSAPYLTDHINILVKK